MAWGTPATAEVAEPIATPVVTTCEFPDCNEAASLMVDIGGGEFRAACAGHSQVDGVLIVGVVEGAEYNEVARDLLLKRWEVAKATLDTAKATEMEIRKAVGKFVFPTPKEGVNNHDLGNGYTLKYGHKLNYGLEGSIADIEAVEDAATELGNEGKFLIERIIVWKAEFSKSEYNKLDTSLQVHANVKKLVDTILKIAPGSPTLEIREPKA